MVKHRSNSANHWDVHLCATCFEIPLEWLTAFFCPPCVAFTQRRELLDHDMSRYQCCGGMICPQVTDCFTRPCPTLCLGIEACFCFWCAVSANRGIIQDTYDIENTCCEECMIWTACIFSCVYCIVRMFVNLPEEVDCLVDCGYLALSACFQSQQMHELELRKRGAPQQMEMEGR